MNPNWVVQHEAVWKKWVWMALAIAITLVIAGCAAGLGSSIKVGYDTTAEYTRQTRAQAIAGVLTKEQVAKRLAMIEQAQIALDNATLAYATCQSGDSKACASSESSLSAAQLLLRQYEAMLLQEARK